MDKFIRSAIKEIINNNTDVLKVAIRQKAKFEGWLKFELASYLELNGFGGVEVEALSHLSKERADILFFHQENTYTIELKTPNTNWKIEGISNLSKPITKNIDSIIEDTRKLNSKYGIVAFVLFPVPCDDNRWETYLSRITDETGIDISKDKNCEVINFNDGQEINCNLVVCTYMSKRLDDFDI